ncbi:MAG: hypothetical protein WCP85_02465 [Mariniphaga sp.]
MKKKYSGSKVLFLLMFVIQLFILPTAFAIGKGAKVKQNNLKTSGRSSSDTSVAKTEFRDLYSDTWVANDALGRKMPDFKDVGPLKTDKRRIVSIFYITWHTQDHFTNFKSPYSADVSKVLKSDPTARLDAKHPLWKENSYHWGEPEMGYFLSQDEYVIRKDMSMLTDAGVDVLILDVTNAVRYWDEWEVLFNIMHKMKAEGNKVPQFCFWAFNGQVITVVQDLFDRIYKSSRFSDLWFYWDGKPLLLYNGNPKFDANGQDVKQPNPHYDALAKTDINHPHYNDPDYTEPFYKDYTKEVRNFFTLRTMWWGYYQWAGKRYVGTEDNWSFGYDLGNEKVKKMDPDSLVSVHNGKKEEAAVTPAQHPSSLVGKSWRRETGQPALNEYDRADSAYVPWLGKTVRNPEGYGIYFQDRWNEALKSDPEMLYINDWNEWTAGKYQPEEGKTFQFMRRKSPYFFVDQYNAEFNRCIQPMKDGYTDNYYMQMAQNIRRYKGVRPQPVQKELTKIQIDGEFEDWKMVTNEFRDTRGDTYHRDHNGYGGLHYANQSGKNDIITAKIAVNKVNVFFYAETTDQLTSYTDNNWMLLLIDADNNPETGWFGYDFLINKNVKDSGKTLLLRYDNSNSENKWVSVSYLNYRTRGNEMEIEVPRKAIGLTTNKFIFDFKWSDNASDLHDPISLCTDGDTAPNRRFNYRFIWDKE